MNPTDTRPDADQVQSILENDLIPDDKHYRLTGELPTPGEEAAPSRKGTENNDSEVTPTPDAAAAPPEIDPKGDIASAPPAELTQRAPKGERRDSDKRWKELSERVGARERENEALRRRLEELERKPSAETRDTAASQPAAEKPATERAKPKLTDTDPKTGKPFASLEAWTDAVDEYHDARMQAKLDERFSKVEQTRTQTDQQRRIIEEVYLKMQPAREKYSDYEKVAGNPALPVMAGSPVDLFVQKSAHPGEIAYYLGKHPEILAEFYGCLYDPATGNWDYKDFDHKTGKYTNHVDPIDQFIRLAAIERDITTSATSTAPARATAPAKRITNAPPPPHQVNATSTSTVDPLQQAALDDDQDRYTELANARDIARRKGR